MFYPSFGKIVKIYYNFISMPVLIFIPDSTAEGEMENQTVQLIGGNGSILWNSSNEGA